EGPATFMSRMVRNELEEQQRDRTLFQWTKRPWVLVTMLAGCIAVLVWTFWPKPRPDQEELFARGSQLMDSLNYEDWDKAWTEYLEPLSQDPRNTHREKLHEFEQRREDAAMLRRALPRGDEARARSDAHRFYLRGLRLCRDGDIDGAREVWQSVVELFE